MRYSHILPAAIFAVVAAPVPALFAQDMSPTSANGFVTMVAIGDMYEVKAGKLAETKGSSSEVKAFGRHMVQAHTQTTEKLKAALKKSGLNITPPSQLDDKHQK